MPQLEQVEFFISQLFWLGVFFVILFSNLNDTYGLTRRLVGSSTLGVRPLTPA